MKKCMLFVGFTLSVFSLFPHDVTIYVQGLHNSVPVHLDSIVINNISQPSSVSFTSLPPEAVRYEINLSKGTLNGIDTGYPSGKPFSVFATLSGEIWISVNTSKVLQPTLFLYTITGALIQSQMLTVGPETGYIHVRTGSEPMCILQLVYESNSCSFKIPGGLNTNTGVFIETTQGLGDPTLRNEAVKQRSDFIYSPGDKIKIFIYKGTMYPGKSILTPVNNQTVSIFLYMPCPESTLVYDYDGNAYRTILLGSQCWIRESLRTTHYMDGTPLVDGTNAGNIQLDFSTPWYFSPNNDPSNDLLFGKLYSGAVIYQDKDVDDPEKSGTKNICPEGWHVATDNDWKEFEGFLGMEEMEIKSVKWRGTIEGGKIKDTGSQFFFPPNSSATNESGFGARGAGIRSSDEFLFFQNSCVFWTSTQPGNYYLMGRMVDTYNSGIYRHGTLIDGGFSIRCIKD